MQRRVLAVFTVLVVGGFLGFVPVQARQSAPQQTEVLRRRTGVPITALLKKGQQEVVVSKDQDPPLFAEPPNGMGQLEWMTQGSPYVVVARVKGLKPSLTPTEDWISTTVLAEIEAVIKEPERNSAGVGTTIEFPQDGGRMTISGVRVHAQLPWATEFAVDEQYLLFARRDQPEGTWRVSHPASYRIGSDQRLVSLARDVGTPSARPGMRSEDGVALGDALARIRQVKKTLLNPEHPL